MSVGTLFSAASGFQTKKLKAVGEFANVKFTVECLSRAKPANDYPIHQGVYFVTNQGQHLFNANTIACYLSNALKSDNALEVFQWLDVADTQFLPHVLSWVLPCLSAMAYNKAEVEDAKKQLIYNLGWLNNCLLTKTFIVGQRLSVADIVLACNLLPAFQHVLDDDVRKKFANVTRWLMTVVNQPFFKNAVGPVVFCKQAVEHDAKKFKDFKATHVGDVPKSATVGKKASKEKHPPAKKEPEPKSSPAIQDDEDEQPSEHKQKDPFAAMAKGKFDMDFFKRVYSNEDTATKAIPYFWRNFDPQHYSIWYGEYKYPNELTKVFMSCNLVAGMFQRLERLRKNAFASVCVFGEDNANTISGIWVWRGHELAFLLSDDWQIDYESYSWQKLDPKQEETKTLVNDYLMWEGNFDGKKFNQGKIFK